MKLVQCLGKLVCNIEQVLSKCLHPLCSGELVLCRRTFPLGKKSKCWEKNILKKKTYLKTSESYKNNKFLALSHTDDHNIWHYFSPQWILQSSRTADQLTSRGELPASSWSQGEQSLRTYLKLKKKMPFSWNSKWPRPRTGTRLHKP